MKYSEEVFTDKEGLEYRTFRDKEGVQRRHYKAACIECGCERMTARHRVHNQERCKECAKKMSPTPEQRKKISATLRHKYATDADFKRRVAAAQNQAKGADHWNWKGGVTPINQRMRTSEESNAWKLAVLHRDHYKCRICEETSGLHAHHINSWAEFPEDRFVIQNGLTLCENCHSQYHKYEKEVRKNANQT